MMNKTMQRYVDLIEGYLTTCFSSREPQQLLFESMRYSLLAGGKRLRPVLVMAFCELCGGDAERALPFAAAMEMVHTYSLIHDDLPCMDNDTLRRGKPTSHVVYGECTATLAGDALQAAAFSTLLRAGLPARRLVDAAAELAFAAGEKGMCGGQILDMQGEGRSLSVEELSQIHDLKTAAMIRASARIGVICGGGSERQLAAAEKYACGVGLAFQIRDDILDIISTTEELGKPVGSDRESGKSTFATVLGIPRCEEIIEEETQKAKNAIAGQFENEGFFCWLADLLAKRNS